MSQFIYIGNAAGVPRRRRGTGSRRVPHFVGLKRVDSPEDLPGYKWAVCGDFDLTDREARSVDAMIKRMVERGVLSNQSGIEESEISSPSGAGYRDFQTAVRLGLGVEI